MQTHLVTVLHQYPTASVVLLTNDDRAEVLRNAKALAETNDIVRVFVARFDDGQLIATFPDPNAATYTARHYHVK